MSTNLDKHFEFASREAELYKLWEQNGILQPESAQDQKAPVFNICMPPPNANGELHLGHAFGHTVMDILGRYHRLLGERVMLLPGKDHAGIQTQVVFEKKLQKEGVDYRQTPTAELYKQCYDFCTDRSAYMRAQEKTLGVTCDWSRELFTLDPGLTDIIYETFVKLWNDGLVYRGKRIINWSVFSQTGISDVEVEYREQEGALYYLAYPWADAAASSAKGLPEVKLPSGKTVKTSEVGLVTATTRPETMLGDTALVVHPDDERYKNVIGREVIVPLTGRKIKIIADARVDLSFGAGVLKLTPAHDFLDYEIGETHKLDLIQVIGFDGKMTDAVPEEFRGLKINACREAVVKRLEEEGRLLETTKITHKVPVGERGKDIIEPLLSEQWFVAVNKPGKSLTQAALKKLRSGEIKIYPERFQVLFEQWLENLRDWNISRQLWWGHKLPVWYKGSEVKVSKTEPTGGGWTQETDTFDTWFSSGQWAFSTLMRHDLMNKDYFPTHTMVMGRDILFFWACRMLLLTTYRLDQVPWKNIFFTGLIRDEHGQKMSKSKGNGIEPGEILSKYGCDALRLALVIGAAPGNDINLGVRKVEGYSKFTNKLWNASKLVEMKLGAGPVPELPKKLELESSRWILGELTRVHTSVTKHFNEYDLSLAAEETYKFSWTVFCDWYLEVFKVLFDKGTEAQKAEVSAVVVYCLRSILTMLHPLIPFVTEEIFQKLTVVKNGDLLARASWKLPRQFEESASQMSALMGAVNSVRSVKSVLGIPHQRIRAALKGDFSPELMLLAQELARVDWTSAETIPADKALRKAYIGGEVVCEVDGKPMYRARLEKDISQNKTILSALEAKLAGPFATQGKPEVVAAEREKLDLVRQALSALERELTGLAE